MNELRREYLLDVVRMSDGKSPSCGVRYATLSISYMKAIEVATVAEMKKGSGVSARVNRSCPAVVNDVEAQWLDTDSKAMKPAFRLFEHLTTGSNLKTRIVTLIQIDRDGGFYLWNMVGKERVRTLTIPVSALVANFRAAQTSGGLVANGMRVLMKQELLELDA